MKFDETAYRNPAAAPICFALSTGEFIGYAKNEAHEASEDSADRWQTAAEINGYRCLICGEIPPFEEREIFFETKLCAPHAYRMQKDD